MSVRSKGEGSIAKKIFGLSRGRLGSLLGNRAGFHDFSGLQTAYADIDRADGPIGKTGFHTLKVGIKTAAGNTGDLFTDTARFLGETSPGNGAADNGFFIANGAVLHKAGHYSREMNLGKQFFLLYTHVSSFLKVHT